MNKVPSPWPQYSPWTRFPHPAHTLAHRTPCRCCRGSMQQHLPWTRFPHPARTRDTLHGCRGSIKHLPWTKFPHPDHSTHREHPAGLKWKHAAALTVNKVPFTLPRTPARGTPCRVEVEACSSTHHEQGSLTLPAPQHAGHPAVLTVNKVPSPCPHPSTQDTLQYSPWTRLPHPDHTPAPRTPCSVVEAACSSTYREQGSLTLTASQHVGQTYSVVEAACSSTNCEQGSLTLTTVLTVNKVSSLCLHPSMWDTLQCCRGSMQQHLPWTRFPHCEHSTHHEQGSLTLTAPQHMGHPAVL